MSRYERQFLEIFRCATPVVLAVTFIGCVPNDQTNPDFTSELTISSLPIIRSNLDCLPGTSTRSPDFSEPEKSQALLRANDFQKVLKRVIRTDGLLNGYQPLGDATVINTPNNSLLPTFQPNGLLDHANPHLQINPLWHVSFEGEKTSGQFQSFTISTVYENCGPFSHTAINASINRAIIKNSFGQSAISNNEIRTDRLSEILRGIINIPTNSQLERGVIELQERAKDPTVPLPAVKASGQYPDGSKYEAVLNTYGILQIVTQEPK